MHQGEFHYPYNLYIIKTKYKQIYKKFCTAIITEGLLQRIDNKNLIGGYSIRLECPKSGGGNSHWKMGNCRWEWATLIERDALLPYTTYSSHQILNRQGQATARLFHINHRL